MEPSVYVKVVGFRDVERHALNTVFRLSIGRPTSYGLWTPEVPKAPDLILIDLDSYEAGLLLASPGMSANLKMICVGRGAPANAWYTFERPLHWPAVVKAMDSLFVRPERDHAGIDLADQDLAGGLPLSSKVSLLVDPSREDRMYLRARLALAGLTDVEDAATGAQALELAKNRHYDLAIVGLDLPDMDGWALIRALMALEPAVGSVIVTSTDKSGQAHQQAAASGCRGLLEKPYEPSKVVQLLQLV